MYTREGFGFSSFPSTKVAHSLSHSPLPVLSLHELHGPIRHNDAVQLGSRIKKTQLLTTSLEKLSYHKLVLKSTPKEALKLRSFIQKFRFDEKKVTAGNQIWASYKSARIAARF